MKVKFPLQENYFKVSLFTFIVIFIDFSLFSDHEKKKKYWTSTCWFSNTVISKIFEILLSAEFISHRFITFPLLRMLKIYIFFFIFQTSLWILTVFKNCTDLLLYRPLLQQENWKSLDLLSGFYIHISSHLQTWLFPALYTALSVGCRSTIQSAQF